jgi:WD40 repeat protein
MSVRKGFFLAIVSLGLAISIAIAVTVINSRPAAFRGHTARIENVVASPDGKTLASTDKDNTIKVWDVPTRKERFTLQGVEAVFSPDGKTLTTKGETIRHWDAATGQERATCQEPESRHFIDTIDGRSLLSTNGWTIRLRGFVQRIALSPDDTIVAAGDNTGMVYLCDVATGTLQATLEGLDEDIEQVVFSPDGKTVAALDLHGAINCWDVASGKNTATFERTRSRPPRPRLLKSLWNKYPELFEDHSDIILSLFFTPGGVLIALGHDARDETVVKMWRVPIVPATKK